MYIYIYIHNIHFHIYVPLETYEIRFRHKFRTILNIVWNPWHQYWTHGGNICKNHWDRGQNKRNIGICLSYQKNNHFALYGIQLNFIILYYKTILVLCYDIVFIWHSMIGYCMMFFFFNYYLYMNFVYIYIYTWFNLICSTITSYDMIFYLFSFLQEIHISYDIISYHLCYIMFKFLDW